MVAPRILKCDIWTSKRDGAKLHRFGYDKAHRSKPSAPLLHAVWIITRGRIWSMARGLERGIDLSVTSRCMILLSDKVLSSMVSS